MYSLLDMHQDVLTSRFGHEYDGAPLWLVNKTQPRRPFPWPHKKISSWGQSYSTEAIGQCFQVNGANSRNNYINTNRPKHIHANNSLFFPRLGCLEKRGYRHVQELLLALIRRFDHPHALLTGYLQKCVRWARRVV